MPMELDTLAMDALWNTIVTQLRSKLVAKEIAGELEQTHLDEPLTNELIMTAKSGFLSVWLEVDTGEGSWNVITERVQEAEPWFLSPGGQVELSGESMDIPTAVDRFIEKISPK